MVIHFDVPDFKLGALARAPDDIGALWGVDPRSSLKRHRVSMFLISVLGPLPVLFFSFTNHQFIAGIFVLADVGTSYLSVAASIMLTILSLAKYLFIVALFAIGYMWAKQDVLLYVPEPGGMPRENSENPEGFRSPEDEGLPFENVSIKSGDIFLHAWLMLQPEETRAQAPTLIMFHGNAGNVGTRVGNYKELYDKCKVNVLAAEYRGYGDSDGEPSESGIAADAPAYLRYLRTRDDIAQDRIFVFGRSFGGAVAIHLAVTAASFSSLSIDMARKLKAVCANREHPGLQLDRPEGAQEPVNRPHAGIRGIIVENTFTSVEEMALYLFPFLEWLKPSMPWILKSQWRSQDKLRKCVPCPILFMSGSQDHIVPPAQMESLFETAQQSLGLHVGDAGPLLRMKKFTEGGHSDLPLVGGDEYTEQISSFIDDISSVRVY